MLNVTINVHDTVTNLVLLGFICLAVMSVVDYEYHIGNMAHWISMTAGILLFGIALLLLLLVEL